MERRIRTLTAVPGCEWFREQDIASPQDPFGSTEIGLQSVIPELHIHEQGDKLAFSLDNPIKYGPVVVVHSQKEEMLVPGETLVTEDSSLVVFAKGPGGTIITMLFDYAETMSLS